MLYPYSHQCHIFQPPIATCQDISLTLSLVPDALKCGMTGDVYIQKDTYTQRHPKTHLCIYILPS